MLRPQNNLHRHALNLSGFWHFKADPQDEGQVKDWHQDFHHFLSEPVEVAVPGSFNEQLEARGLMNFVGATWLARKVFIPAHFKGQHISLYFGSADFHATVWVNGAQVASHDMPFLPFEAEISKHVTPGEECLVAVRLDGRLSHEEPLMGVTKQDYVKENRLRDEIFPAVRFDFFPYGGIHRPPFLCARAPAHVQTLNVQTKVLSTNSSKIVLNAQLSSTQQVASLSYALLDANGLAVAQGQIPASHECEAQIDLTECTLWQVGASYLYRLQVSLIGTGGASIDSVEQSVGIREIKVAGHQLLLNGKPLMLRGYGMHEDHVSLGKGQALAVTVRDLELLRWTGANSLRTSHYPYAEETLDLADRQGLLVISELACINLDFRKANDRLLERHHAVLQAQIARDNAHPSVIMWSIANEPGYLGEREYVERSGPYWQSLVAKAKQLDPTRPVTMANVDYATRDDPGFEACDVVCINRYYGWYNRPGQLDEAIARMDEELEHVAKHGKPVIVTEFGADAIAGEHSLTDQLFTEEYQARFLQAYIRLIESKPYAAGALVWNFADFRTAQHFRRVIVNRKGIFTRDRQPKAAAFTIKQIWGSAANVP